MSEKRLRLGELLLQWGVVNQTQMEEALQMAEGTRRRLGEVLVELKFVSDVDVDVARAMASQLGLKFVAIESPDAIPPEVIRLLPIDVIKKYRVLPLGQDGRRLRVLVSDPLDLETLDALRFRLGCEVDASVGARSQIMGLIDRLLGQSEKEVREAVESMTFVCRQGSLDTSIISIDRDGHSIDLARQVKESVEAGSAPVIRLVNSLIAEAVDSGASDVHIEPMARGVRLRLRIDGVCVERDTLPKRVQDAVLTRLKILANVKVQEKRVPQDGRIRLLIKGRAVDFRFASCPGSHGESVVLRILRPDSARVGLDRLGLPPDTQAALRKAIQRSNGMVLVTGPTGSGKTTTLYSALSELNRPDRKIITAEDPVEYSLKGINQCQIHEGIGLTFSAALRAMLRQAPQVVLIGEIRDREVADVAVQASLTGHLVFSTMHTNDAPSAITRMIDLGVKPFLVACAVHAVLAQRLVRVLCESCKVPDTNPDGREVRLCGLTSNELSQITIYKPVGCPQCNGQGYRGRQGVHEFMVMNGALKKLTLQRAGINQLRAAAADSGMRNLLGSGRLLIRDGKTTADEVSRVAQVESPIGMEVA